MLSIITGGGKWVEIKIPANSLYQHLLLTAEKEFWRSVENGEPPHLFGVEPPRVRIEAVRIVDMSSSNAWAEFSSVFRRTREAYVEHENAKARPAKQANITVTLPKPMTSGAKADGRFGKRDFVYSAAEDVYRCSHRHTNEEDGKITPLLDDGVPTLPAQVSVYDGRGTAHHAWEHEHLLEAEQQRLDANPQAMRQRRETVEHPFATQKMRMGANHSLMQRLPKVATEMALHEVAYNLTRVIISLVCNGSWWRCGHASVAVPGAARHSPELTRQTRPLEAAVSLPLSSLGRRSLIPPRPVQTHLLISGPTAVSRLKSLHASPAASAFSQNQDP